MKKVIIVLAIVLFIIAGIFYTRLALNGITPEQAALKVINHMEPRLASSITNLDNPKIEEVVFADDIPFYYFVNESFVLGKTLYKITFSTDQDGLLGPLIYYVDKESGITVGFDYRE